MNVIEQVYYTLNNQNLCCSYIYEPSTAVLNVVNILDEQRSSIVQLQEKHGVKVN